MSIRLLLIILAICLNLPALHAIRAYITGDTLYVWAASGLSLRRQPDLNAEKIAAVPYGTALVALSDKFVDAADDVVVEAAPGYTMNDSVSAPVYLNGRFVKVNYQGTTGYLFDGYLSKWPTMRYTKIKNRDGTIARLEFEEFHTYARRTFGILHEWRDSASYSCIYKNGVTEIQSFIAEEDKEVRIVLPNLSWEEMFLIFNLMQGYEHAVRKYPSINPSEYPWKFRRRAGAAGPVLDFDEGGDYFTIQSLDDQRLVIFTYSLGGC